MSTFLSQFLNQLARPLGRDHDAKLWIHRQRRHDTRIDHVHILHADNRGIDIDTRPDPARGTPMIHLALGVGAGGGDILCDIGLRRRLGEVERREARAGQGGEDAVDERGDVLGVLRVGVVDALRARDEIAVEHDFAHRFQPAGAVDVERHGRVRRVPAVPRGADGALHAGDAAVAARDRVPEDADLAREAVWSRPVLEIGSCVGRGRVVVDVGVGLDGRAGQLDECVWVVEQARAHGGVVDPLRCRQAAELVGLGEAREDGGIADARFHEQFRGFQSAAADDDTACGFEREGGGGAVYGRYDPRSGLAIPDNALHPGAALEVEVAAGERRLHIADCGATTLAVIVVVDRVAEHLGLFGGIGVDICLGVTGIRDEPLLRRNVTGLQVFHFVDGRSVARWLRRIQPVNRGDEIRMLPSSRHILVEI